jgi:hypothetical protein
MSSDLTPPSFDQPRFDQPSVDQPRSEQLSPGRSSRHPEYRGHAVLDDQQRKVGTVTDVLYDHNGQPQWFVVGVGLLRSEHFVPLQGSYLSRDGEVITPFDKQQLKRAPKAGRDHIITASLEERLVEHYQLAS